MYVLVKKINSPTVITRNSKLSKVVARGEELINDYNKLIVCTEEYNGKTSNCTRKFICSI